jgi:ribose-phosphate pyrophosphokinase
VTSIVLALPGNEALARALAGRLGAEAGELELRRFPDGETYVRLPGSVAGRAVVLACTLDRPDDKTVPLLLVAATARDLGAARVGLVAPYLAYLRQDDRFQAGEGVTSRYFARLLSSAIDWLVTVDPHLHRIRALAEVYAVPAVAVRAAPLIADWIRARVERPVLIGPDRESEQWVSAAAGMTALPSLVLEKVRRGDREVAVSVPGLERFPGCTPVLLDDIISTGHTMIAALAHLRRLGTAPPVCIGVHAIFAAGAREDLRAAGAAQIVTTNTVPHPSNAIDVSALLAEAVASQP